MESTRKPLYLHIKDYYQDQIQSNILQANEKIPSEKKVMEEFNVSRITVANAFSRLANEGWIYRIPGRGSFVAERKDEIESSHGDSIEVIERETENEKQKDKKKETEEIKSSDPKIKVEANKRNLIGLIMPSIDDFFAIRLIKGIEKVIEDTPFSLVIMTSNNSKLKEKKVIKELITSGVSGLLIFPVEGESYNDEILALKVQNFPFVLIDRYLPGVDTHYVCSDNKLGAQMAISHLWETGHRKIAICSNTRLPTVTVEDRLAGYMNELENRNSMIDPNLIRTNLNLSSFDNYEEDHPFVEFIKSRQATAFLALDNKLGIFIARTAKKLGLSIPEDIEIVTFDDPSPGYEEFGYFTHISQSEGKIGAEASKILIDLLSEPEFSEYQQIVHTPELVIQKTTKTIE